jgi:hemolysin type calcium-binding protein
MLFPAPNLWRILAILVVLAAVAVPARAAASTTDVDLTNSNQTLLVNARGTERNLVTVTTDSADAPTALLIADAGAGVDTDDALCSQPTPASVSCPIAAVTRVDVNLGNLDDTLTITAQVPASIRATPDGSSGNDGLITAGGNDTLNGGSGNDTLLGGPGSDLLDGDSGNDFLGGQEGPDSLGGDQNDDLLDGGPGSDSIRGGSNFDTVTYAAHSPGVVATIGGFPGTDGNGEDGPTGAADTIDLDVEGIIGSSGADLLGGDGVANTILGGEGDDTVLGGAGGDHLLGQGGRDRILGQDGNDLLKGGSGRDRMTGGFGNDLLKARDGLRDKRLNCGGGRHDRLRRDHRDPHGKSC